MIAFPGRMRRTRPLKDTTPHDRNQWLHGSSGWTGKGAASMPDNARAAVHTPGQTCKGGGTWAFPARPHDRCGGSAGQADKTACHDPPWLHARMQTANALLLPVELQGEEAPCEHQPGYSTGSGKNFPRGSACIDRASSGGATGSEAGQATVGLFLEIVRSRDCSHGMEPVIRDGRPSRPKQRPGHWEIHPRVVPSRASSAARPLRRQPAWASRAPVPRYRSPRTVRRAGGSRGCHQGCRRSSRACRPRRPSSRALRCAAR